MAIDRDLLRQSISDKIMTITYQVDKKTAAIVLKPSLALIRGTSIEVIADIRDAGYLEGIDKRLDNQRQSIDRLLEHLKQHCPKLLTGEPCNHLE